MKDSLYEVISAFELQVTKLNLGRSAGAYKKLLVTILGQQALLIQREKIPNLHLLATTDFDAFLKGEVPLEDIFKKILTDFGLAYDNKSEYIWLPKETKYELIYESGFIRVDSPQPIYLLVSKAVKAPEKNKQLIIAAIVEFGEELLSLLVQYKADIEYFTGE